MGRKSRRQHSDPPAFATKKGWHEHFTPMFDSQLNSPAYNVLSNVAKVMYLILRQEYKGESYNGNRVKCPYTTFMAKGISRNSIPEGIRMLEAFGFVECKSGGLHNQPNIYIFSEEWKKIESVEEGKKIRKMLSEDKARRKASREKLT